ncbi:MAG TPA: hypothetical protein VGE82_02155 [Nitrososphaera sp.]
MRWPCPEAIIRNGLAKDRTGPSPILLFHMPAGVHTAFPNY